MEITEEMVVHFLKRTRRHIDAVNAFGQLVGYQFFNHDLSKYSQEEREAYTLLTWKYKTPVQYDTPTKEKIERAVFQHLKNNAHHPEFWDDGYTLAAKRQGALVNAALMPQDSIIEMCADWCAMSEELGDNPVDFMNKAFKTKFKFTPDQKKLIRKTIQKMWPVPVNVAALISGKQI